jgi:hypothetical protein
MDPRTERMLAERRAAEAAGASGPRTQRLTKATTWLTGYWRLALGATTIVLFAVMVGHYLLVTLPARERDRLLAEQRDAGQQHAIQHLEGGVALETCLADADAAYAASWDAACKTLRRAAECALPAPQAEPLDAARRQARESCVKRHAGQ